MWSLKWGSKWKWGWQQIISTLRKTIIFTMKYMTTVYWLVKHDIKKNIHKIVSSLKPINAILQIPNMDRVLDKYSEISIPNSLSTKSNAPVMDDFSSDLISLSFSQHDMSLWPGFRQNFSFYFWLLRIRAKTDKMWPFGALESIKNDVYHFPCANTPASVGCSLGGAILCM